MKKILFVCLGNICRSPAAEAVMKAKLKKVGKEEAFYVDSAGTYGGPVSYTHLTLPTT